MNILYFYTSKECEESPNVSTCRDIKSILTDLGAQYFRKDIKEPGVYRELRKILNLDRTECGSTPVLVITSATGEKLIHYHPKDFVSTNLIDLKENSPLSWKDEISEILNNYEIGSS